MQNRSKKEIKQSGRIQNRKKATREDFDLSSVFERIKSNKKYVNSKNLHEIKNENLEDYTSDFN